MPTRLSDILVISDMDGTLLTPQNTIAETDLETIRLFRMLGGHFTVATGRSFASVAMYPKLAALLAPAVTMGGCVVYNFQKKAVERSLLLPPLAAKQALRNIVGSFPRLGTVIMANDARMYQAIPSPWLQGLFSDERMTFVYRPGEYVPEDWNKILFAGPEDLLQKVEEYVATRSYPGLYFIRTHPHYFEMMPKGASKATGLHMLCELMDISPKNTYMIGDYYNDIDIMKQAGCAVAMANAPDEVKMVAHELTDSNERGGVGQYLYKIIKKYAE